MPSALSHLAYESSEEGSILAYLTGLYRNVFTDEAIKAHLVNHVGYPVAQYGLGVITPLVPAGGRILDVGCGFGSFVLLAREAGFDACGVEIAPFEVEFARRRHQRLRPQDDAQAIYQIGDATKLDFPVACFDAITFWNVFEHVEDVEPLIAFAARALKPSGHVFIVCPNYAAERLEAHYHIPWKPELRHDRAKVAEYIRSLGRDSEFFETSIFCRTNDEVLGLLRRYRFELMDIEGLRPMSFSVSNLLELWRHREQVRAFYDSGRPSVWAIGRKPGSPAA
jgi:MPBQ/MSBQ methyltransferase